VRGGTYGRDPTRSSPQLIGLAQFALFFEPERQHVDAQPSNANAH